VFARVRSALAAQRLVTAAQVYGRLAARMAGGDWAPYDFVVVDEAQDVSVAQLRFVAALGRGRPDALFFAGDLGQRILQLPFSWKSLGVDVRGRSATLRINYRTSHQIRAQADRLLGKQISDVDGNVEDRRGTISAFNGPPPMVRVLQSPAEEERVVGHWLAERAAQGSRREKWRCSYGRPWRCRGHRQRSQLQGWMPACWMRRCKRCATGWPWEPCT
jgi:superfamily I DNA/RNA helicase